MPKTVDVPALASRFAAAAGDTADSLLLAGANHNLSQPEGATQEFVRATGRWLEQAE